MSSRHYCTINSMKNLQKTLTRSFPNSLIFPHDCDQRTESCMLPFPPTETPTIEKPNAVIFG